MGRMTTAPRCSPRGRSDGTACATRSGAEGAGALSVSITDRCRKRHASQSAAPCVSGPCPCGMTVVAASAATSSSAAVTVAARLNRGHALTKPDTHTRRQGPGPAGRRPCADRGNQHTGTRREIAAVADRIHATRAPGGSADTQRTKRRSDMRRPDPCEPVRLPGFAAVAVRRNRPRAPRASTRLPPPVARFVRGG